MDSAAGKSVNTSKTKERKVSVPGIGIATQMPNGEIRVKYPDGSQLWVDGRHHIKYQHADGRLVNYLDTDNIPRQIMEKLQHMPKVLKCLLPSSVVSKTRSLR